MKLFNMIGYKLYKTNEDGSIHMIRIVGMHKPFKITETTKDPTEITILDYEDNTTKKVRVDSLSEYSPLEPDAMITASIVTVTTDSKGTTVKDVIVSVANQLEIKLGITKAPYAVCRQNITDIFNNLVSVDESDMLVGLSVSRDTCPANFNYKIMFAANKVEYTDFINFYREDKLEDLYSMLSLKKFDDVLKDLYIRHINHINKPELMFKNEHGGWCRDLKTLLSTNNFQYDINQMLGITEVNFEVNDYLVENPIPGKEDETYLVARDDLRYWLSYTFKVNMKEAAFLEWDHTVNLGDFKDARYLMLRDSANKTYVVIYLIDGEEYTYDLEAKAKELDFESKFRIEFYNKAKANDILK